MSGVKEKGLSPFRGVLRDVKELWAWAAGSATVPFLANLVSLAPPWPPAIIYITAIIELIGLILACQFFKSVPTRAINRTLGITVSILLAASVVYLGLLSEFTFTIPGEKTPGVKGFVCTSDAAIAFREKCPWLGELELKQAEWSANLLWTSWSITLTRVSLVVMWMLTFMMLSLMLGSFVVHQRRGLH